MQRGSSGTVVTTRPEYMYLRNTHRARMSGGVLMIGVMWVVVVVVVEGGSACVSDLDCSLNGACLASGHCECDAAWEVRVYA